MTKEEFIEMIEEAIPDDRQITAYTIAFELGIIFNQMMSKENREAE